MSRMSMRSLGDVPEEEVNQVVSGDVVARMGRQTKVIDTRAAGGDDIHRMPRPRITRGTLYNDLAFTQFAAMKGEPDRDILWKRPREFCDDPQLFTDGTTRFDIKQGGAGTCWFLSILSSIADKPEIIKQVLPPDCYQAGGSRYDGVFHCRLWRFGEWVDVYVDDYLPVKDGQDGEDGRGVPWGARSTDPREMWVSLLEKAFAWFHGGYPKIYGGWAGDAFITLTGGVAERVDVETVTPGELYRRVRNCLKAGAIIACSAPLEKDGCCGLAGGHAYTLTGATLITFGARKVRLMRVRNPWGAGEGEWTGRWSDASGEWNLVTDEVKKELKVSGKADGEFWMALEDYYDYFKDTHICSFTPDFDKDGNSDGLDDVTTILGEWRGATAAGIDWKMMCLKYKFRIDETSDLDEDGKMPVVIQVIQKKEHRRDTNYIYIKLSLYRIEATKTKDEQTYSVLDDVTNFHDYYRGPAHSYRYRLLPGRYLLVPHTLEKGEEKQYCVRFFTKEPLPVEEVRQTFGLFVRNLDTLWEANDIVFETEIMQHFLVEWKSGVNAGGQISNNSFATNPQFLIKIDASVDMVPISLAVSQMQCKPIIPIGYKIFKVNYASVVPLKLNYLYKNYSDALSTVKNEQVFVVAEDAQGQYLLPPGQYVAVVFTDDPGDERKFTFVVAHPKDGVSVTTRAFNMADKDSPIMD